MSGTENDLDLTTGKNFALKRLQKIDCNSANTVGFGDYGDGFDDTNSNKDFIASIEIPADVVCDQSGNSRNRPDPSVPILSV